MERFSHVTAALREIPTLSRVEARLDAASGDVSLCVAGTESSGCKKDDVLLSMPLARCITSADLKGHPIMDRIPPSDGFGRLLVAMLVLLHGDGPDGDERAACMRRLVPTLEQFSEFMMARWPEDSVAARRVANSCSWRRARMLLEECKAESPALAEAGLDVNLDSYMWAKLVVQTRAINFGGEVGHAWVPLVDMGNHNSEYASVRFATAPDANGELEVQLVANRNLDVGDEVTLNYDPDADFLDLFERYGFFDEKNGIRTVEVIVPPSSIFGLQSVAADVEQHDYIKARIVRDAFADLDSWWVPEIRPEMCPLMCAVRATVLSTDELKACGPLSESDQDEDPLKSPIKEEVVARKHFVELIRAHLSKYSTTVAQDTAELESLKKSVSPDLVEAASLRLSLYEKSLLSAHVASVGARQ